ncbi:MAG: putative beta-lysine N-acetyltransferase [Salinivirgaceae bacterium]|jgi:putative beta-lysine N-acetyltransferase|nr:putative beta-lysine N-acetyltransferase [Salinivirgaceae bacterium]
MNDTIETLKGGSIIQHGKHNDRIYLIKLNNDPLTALESLKVLANENKYAKIICKVPFEHVPLFFSDGFIMEATIPRFYKKDTNVFFMSKFMDSDRLMSLEKDSFNELNKLLVAKETNNVKAMPKLKLRRLDKTNIERIVEIYRDVFLSYPFPIHNPDYILKTMDNDVQYYGAEKGGNIIAIASCEIDFMEKNAEMTDFATDLAFLGNNLSFFLLKHMEDEMKKQGLKTLYTIARLKSIPMNKTFIRHNYTYSGTLIKNTNIAGTIESMNIYYKHI